MRTVCAGFALAAIASPAVVRAQIIDRTQGFPDTTGLAVNQSATPGLTWNAINKGQLVITTPQRGPNNTDPFERESVFSATPVNVTNLATSFDFRIAGTQGWMADGLTFCIQGQGPNALGGSGGGLAYGPDPNGYQGYSIGKSVAVKFDVYQNWPDPSSNCTGLFANGVSPVGGIDLTPYKIFLGSGDKMHADLVYDGSALKVLITDTVTGAYAWQAYTIDIPGTVGGKTAYVGFTGADGGAVASVSVLDWLYKSAATMAKLTSITIAPGAVCGSKNTVGAVTLAEPVQTDTVVNLSSSSALVSAPATVTVPAGQYAATFAITTRLVQSSQTVSVKAEAQGNAVSTTVKVDPIAPDSVMVSADYIPEGASSVGTLTLQAAAAPGAITVPLTSSNPAVAVVPASVTVPAGALSVTFPIATGHVTVNTPVLFTAVLNGVKRTGTLTVRPMRVASVTASATAVSGGGMLTGQVTVERPATPGGIVVLLSSNASYLQVPVSVMVSAGQTTATFPITTTAIKANAQALITASSLVNNVYAKVNVTP